MSATFGAVGLAKTLGSILIKPFTALFLAGPLGAAAPLTLIAATI